MVDMPSNQTFAPRCLMIVSLLMLDCLVEGPTHGVMANCQQISISSPVNTSSRLANQ